MVTEVNRQSQGNYQFSATPVKVSVNTDASYSDITTAGWLNGVTQQPILATDIVEVNYAGNAKGFFNPSISASGVITLSPISNAGEMTFEGAAVVGNLPMSADTSGNQEDSGIAANTVLFSAFTNPLAAPEFVTVSIADVDYVALGAAPAEGIVQFTPAVGRTYQLFEAKIFASDSFAGGGGDRGIAIRAGADPLATIADTVAQDLSGNFYVMGATTFPLAGVFNITSAAPFNISYNTGATDYTTNGQISMSVTLIRTA